MGLGLVLPAAKAANCKALAIWVLSFSENSKLNTCAYLRDWLIVFIIKYKKHPDSPQGAAKQMIQIFLIRSSLLSSSHPDYTVGPGITPDLPKRFAGFTAGKDLHLSPEDYMKFILSYSIP
jgi:hypothetical protein